MNKYYNHIEDCTIYAWNKAMGGDLTHLRLEGGTDAEDITAWESVYNSYIVEIGLGKEYEHLLELQTELADAQLDYIIVNNRMILNKILRLDTEVKDILKSGSQGSDMTTTLLIIGKWLGHRVNQKETTVLELYKMLDLIKAENNG